jgi:hypothetical protein
MFFRHAFFAFFGILIQQLEKGAEATNFQILTPTSAIVSSPGFRALFSFLARVRLCDWVSGCNFVQRVNQLSIPDIISEPPPTTLREFLNK